MIHTLQALLTSLANGVWSHLDQWDAWAVVLAAALYGFRAGSPWMPLIVAVIINPMPYGLVANLIHGRTVALNAAALFTVVQVLLAYAGFFFGRLLKRFR